MYTRAEKYISTVVSMLEMEVISPAIPAGRVGMVVLLMKPVVFSLLELLN